MLRACDDKIVRGKSHEIQQIRSHCQLGLSLTFNLLTLITEEGAPLQHRNKHCINSISSQRYSYHFLCHDSQEISKRDFPRSILVHFTNHLFNLLLLWFKAQSSHCNLEQQQKSMVSEAPPES